MPNGTSKYELESRTGSARVLISGQGRDLGRGPFGSVYGSRVVPRGFNTPSTQGVRDVFGVQNCDMGLPGSTYPLIFDFGAMPIFFFVEAFPMGQQIQQIEPWSAQVSKKGLREFNSAKFLGGRGPLEQLKIGPFDR